VQLRDDGDDDDGDDGAVSIYVARDTETVSF